MKVTAKQIVNFICSLLLAALPFIVFCFPFIGEVSGYQVFDFLSLLKLFNQVEPLYVVVCIGFVLLLIIAALLFVFTIANLIVKDLFNVAYNIIFKIYLAVLVTFFILYMAFYIKCTDTTAFVPISMFVLIFVSVILSTIIQLPKGNNVKQIINIICTMLLVILTLVVFMFPLINKMCGYQIFETLKLAKMLGQVEPLFAAVTYLIVAVLAVSGLLLVSTVGYIALNNNKLKTIFRIMHDVVVQLFIVTVLTLFIVYMVYYTKYVDTAEFIPIALLVLVLAGTIMSALSVFSTNLWYYVLVAFILEQVAGLAILVFLIIKTTKKQSVDIAEMQKSAVADNKPEDHKPEKSENPAQTK